MKIWRSGEEKCARYLARLDNRMTEILPAQAVEKARRIAAAVAARGDKALVAFVRRHDLKGIPMEDFRLRGTVGGGEEVGEDLRGVEFVRQPVPDRNARVAGKLLDDLLAEAAVLDAVVEPAEYASRVLHRFLVPDLGPARPEIGDVGALVVGRHLERHARPGRGLLEDDRDVLAAQALLLVAAVLGGFQLSGERQEELDVARALFPAP